MPAGMQCFDGQGRLTVDFTSRLSRVLGSLHIDGTAGSIYDPNLTQGEPFVSFQQEGVLYHISGDTALPTFTISGSTISWTYSGAQTSYHTNVKGWLFYGVR
ncbi:hypothetical protein [Paraburkholderia aspalathi]|uniref:Uncharacterized protein n=1 Tax=Paraburkholderia aspalathi TaxID=1324617 RepID=A0A1I7EGU3_9BURK|nr:hypothetical protein [Paraburkholderia aspalathi]SFU23159.1 hypothetical protein SAMN05192563_102041 [Paraburkholderia aspalathi]